MKIGELPLQHNPVNKFGRDVETALQILANSRGYIVIYGFIERVDKRPLLITFSNRVWQGTLHSHLLF